jgi:tellurite resistance protein
MASNCTASAPMSHHTALIYTMVMVSAADSEMTDAEIMAIGEEVQRLPIFRDYDITLLPKAAAACAEFLNSEDGLDKLLADVKTGLPKKLHETAYALACDVAVADGKLSQEELRLLQVLRNTLELDRLHSAAIERGARARHAVL